MASNAANRRWNRQSLQVPAAGEAVRVRVLKRPAVAKKEVKTERAVLVELKMNEEPDSKQEPDLKDEAVKQEPDWKDEAVKEEPDVKDELADDSQSDGLQRLLTSWCGRQFVYCRVPHTESSDEEFFAKLESERVQYQRWVRCEKDNALHRVMRCSKPYMVNNTKQEKYVTDEENEAHMRSLLAIAD